jgi:hypothetical protein
MAAPQQQSQPSGIKFLCASAGAWLACPALRCALVRSVTGLSSPCVAVGGLAGMGATCIVQASLLLLLRGTRLTRHPGCLP